MQLIAAHIVTASDETSYWSAPAACVAAVVCAQPVCQEKCRAVTAILQLHADAPKSPTPACMRRLRPCCWHWYGVLTGGHMQPLLSRPHPQYFGCHTNPSAPAAGYVAGVLPLSHLVLSNRKKFCWLPIHLCNDMLLKRWTFSV